MNRSTLRILGRAHRALGASPAMLRIAEKVRNQCAAIVHASLHDGADSASNGEARLVAAFARDGVTAIDVGAHRGGWAELLYAHAPRVGRLVMVEPDPRAHEVLRPRFGGRPECVLVEAAAGAEPGSASFFLEAGATESSSVVPGVSLPGARPTTVRVTTVDDEARAAGLDRVDLLKVDCEGYDLHVLRGASTLLSAEAVSAVQFEYNSYWALAGSTLADAMRYFAQFGYDVYLLRRSGLRAFDYRRFGDFFGYANFVAVAPHARRRAAALTRA